MSCRPLPEPPGVTRLLIAALLLGGCSRTPVPAERSLDRLAPRVSSEPILTLIERLAPLQRLPATPGYDLALDHLAAFLQAGGIPLGPAPGPAGEMPGGAWFLADSLAYEVWEPGPARLEVTGSEGFVVADTERTPMMLAANSRATRPEGILTRMINLGNGTYDREYEGVAVRGAIVYGREPALAIYRKAVLEYGALGVVSPSAPAWQETDTHPDLVAAGLVGPEGFGFQLDRASALRVEAAMARTGGAVGVRVRVCSRMLTGRVLRTLVACLAGSGESDQPVVFIAPISGPAPGAADVSGGAVLAEAAVALRRAVAEGALPAPRRPILFVWGAVLESAAALQRHYPEVVARMHSATVVQLVGTIPVAGEPAVRVERVPDPAAMWTRPPDRHTPLGAARPPWPFPGDSLSPFTRAVLGEVAARDSSWTVGSNPYEGGADHSTLLELGIPAQRIWSFPDPRYHSNLDCPDHIEPVSVRDTALGVTALAWELGAADPATALGIVRLLTDRMDNRMTQVLDEARRNLAGHDVIREGTATRSLEEEIVSAWKIWYLQALDSVLAHPLPGAASGLGRRINVLVHRQERAWDRRILAAGFVPRPLPDRFIPVRDRPR
jgi:hypothetical protein